MAVILVLRALGLGDVLTAVPALRGLRRAHPAHRLVLAAPGALAPLVRLVDAVDELLPTTGLGALRPDRLHTTPELAVNLHGRGPESIADLLAAHPALVWTHRHPAFGALDGPVWRQDMHEVHRWCRLLEHHGVSADPGDLALPHPGVGSPAPGAVVVHPGAASVARRWPLERFAALARALVEDRAEARRLAGDHATGEAADVVVTAGPGERNLATRVAEQAGLDPDTVVAEPDLAGMAALVAEASLVVCGDTGVGHLATAFATPSVLLFGPTPPSRWGPPPDRPWHRVCWAGTTGDPHADTPDAGLLRLSVSEVLRTARLLLPGGRPCQDSTRQHGQHRTSTETPRSEAGPHAGSGSVSWARATSD